MENKTKLTMTNNTLSKTFFLADEAATLHLGQQFSLHLQPGMVVALAGDLGAGKTTFTRGVLRGLGVSERIKSPSYTLLESYECAEFTVFHFDFYRVSRPESLLEIGLEQYFTEQNVCFVEWPELGAGIMPPADVTVTLSLQQSGRQALVQGHSARGLALLGKL